MNTSQSTIRPWRYPAKGIALRLFFTCWIIYALHFSTNIVREIYPALALGDHLSFRVDEYAHMHPDLFEKEGYGWHIGNNPGASMLAAIPYAMARPVIDPIVARVNESREANGQSEPPEFEHPGGNSRQFFAEAWRRGYDIKFALAAFVMQVFSMAPSSALGVVVIFLLMRQLLRSDQNAFWLSLLYAFGTAVFFRTGYLNHNLMLGHIAFFGFVTMWNMGESNRWSPRVRLFVGGVTGGTALLFDYSGAVLLLGLYVYAGLKRWQKLSSFWQAFVDSFWYIAGTLAPVCLLWWYQYRSFGHPFYPGQHWMPPVEWIELGYQGFGWPQFELFWMLGFDYRFGFFVIGPLFLLALAAPFLERGAKRRIPTLELFSLIGIFVVFWIFFSGSNYTRLQFNTGMRYMAPTLPFLFVPAALVIARLPNTIVYFIGLLSVMISWPLAMVRDVEFGPGILNPMLHVFIEGFQLPTFIALERIGGNVYGGLLSGSMSVLPIFALTVAVVYGIWWPNHDRAQMVSMDKVENIEHIRPPSYGRFNQQTDSLAVD